MIKQILSILYEILLGHDPFDQLIGETAAMLYKMGMVSTRGSNCVVKQSPISIADKISILRGVAEGIFKTGHNVILSDLFTEDGDYNEMLERFKAKETLSEVELLEMIKSLMEKLASTPIPTGSR